MDNNKGEINWDELKKKVEDGIKEEENEDIYYEDDVDEGDVECTECTCGVCKKRRGEQDNNIGLPTIEDDDQYDFYDEHGLIDPDDQDIYVDSDDVIDDKEISNLAWNKDTPDLKNNFLGWGETDSFNLNKSLDIKCRHFDEESKTVNEVYIYPINDMQRVCLCKYCNANLASKIFEQIALETFISKV
jgi:hypothetical protein